MSLSHRLTPLAVLRREIEQKLEEKSELERQKETWVLARQIRDELKAIEEACKQK